MADRCSAIDTRVQPSLGGTFEGVQPIGLLDHLVAVKPNRWLLKRDVTAPWQVAVQGGCRRGDARGRAMVPRAGCHRA